MRTAKRVVVAALMLWTGAAFAQGAPASAKAPAPEKKPPTAAPASAKAPEMMMPMKAPAEMDQLKGMVGTWRCDGKMSGGGMDMPMKSTNHIAWDLDNMWLVGHIQGAKAKGMPKAYKGLDYYTYDPEKKEFVMLSIDNMGMYARATSKGWEGDNMVWTGKSTMMGHESDTKMTITKKGDKEILLEGSEGGDHPMTMTITCKK